MGSLEMKQNDDSSNELTLDELTSPSHYSSGDSMNIPFGVIDSYIDDDKKESLPAMTPMLCLADSWTVNDVLLWFKKVENGMVIERYPNITDKLLSLKIGGRALRRIDDETLKKLGIPNPTHRVLVLQ